MGEQPGVLSDRELSSSGGDAASSGELVGPPGRSARQILRVGVAGTGMIGEVHAHAARRAGARLVGVAASTAASAGRAAQRLGAEEAFETASALVTSPDIDVVHICTPNMLHGPLAEEALAAGKHVVCEKPLAVDEDQAQRLVDLAAAADVVATVPFVYRFYPLVREARARLTGGLGPIRLVHGSYLQDWLATEDDDNWRVDPEQAGVSRAFADIGSHWCDLVEFVTGDRLSAVCAELVTAVPERVRHATAHTFDSPAAPHAPGPTGNRDRRPVTTEDIGVVLFRTRQGVSGSLVVSQVSPGRKNRLHFEIATAEATLSFDQEQPETLWVGRRQGSEQLVRDPAQLDPTAAAYVTVPPGHPQGYQDCFDAFVADTYRAIHAGGVDSVVGLPSFVDGARAAVITDAVMRSAASGSWEEVPS